MSQLVGARITEAREAMGLGVQALADQIGVSRTMVYEYENGTKQPSGDTFSKLCSVLDQPARFFYLPEFETEYAHELAHFRSLESLKSDLRSRAGTKLKWTIEYFSVLERKLSLPKLNFPDIDPPEDAESITFNYLENAATEVRRFWNLDDSPIPNVARLFELNGLVVGQMPLNIPGMDGMSFWDKAKRRPFILLNSDKSNCVRSRFDLAHELGHMVLHHNLNKLPSPRTELYKVTEKQAHAFAGAFLLPRRSWLADVQEPTLSVFRFLKPKWKVSIYAQIMRAEAVGRIDEGKKRSLIKQLSNKGWRQREPFDDQWPPEKPKLFGQATQMLAGHGFGISSVLQAYPRSSDDLSDITGLPKAFFDINNTPMEIKVNAFN